MPFKDALAKLVNDSGYRSQAIADPGLIDKDFDLSVEEYGALTQAARLSGVDMNALDKNLATATAAADTSCCCCCCCGESGIALRV
ncbi:hypothetical protein [Variovorax sp. MHTC-1]|uniref:hypothetical protein n=1 Tax=Variovorax sp. MHTC-1 TaxID=2495593 RepID=UPI000F8903C5|nr:hypothetical protein [Variovorax sp. MHTC-1]RST52653.1 hypothetical protein EJI01_15720 [Variovorax sp. MHTC-1]